MNMFPEIERQIPILELSRQLNREIENYERRIHRLKYIESTDLDLKMKLLRRYNIQRWFLKSLAAMVTQKGDDTTHIRYCLDELSYVIDELIYSEDT